ncbi:MAG TPA: IgGFc-binding protein, partial [Candidatus Kapabacteria bacterium]|nr:IgGFc-binding protein [Candidatus Kapabacteria bacterium]
MEFNTGKALSVSRDHLVEQMPPAENWGKTFTFVPSSLGVAKGRPRDGDLIRVIAGYDMTDVFVNGKKTSTLAKGKFKEFKLKTASLITTSQPALVLKYLQTCLAIDTTGDPDMTVLPPIENMSTFYTLPSVASGNAFSEHYVCIVIDSAALNTTTLNGKKLDPAYMYIIPGSRYYHTTVQVPAGSQRVESPLPCYAETYGFGRFDSYSFSGGGSFPYLHSLNAVDLDFGAVLVGASPDSVTKVFSTASGPLTDASQVYGYSWESGDTTVFSLLDTIKTPISVLSNSGLPVHFNFTPPAIGKYQAMLRVWSNNSTPVFINVYGVAAVPSIKVTSIDFGQIRIGRTKIDRDTIINVGDAVITLRNTDYTTDYLAGTPFVTSQPSVIYNIPSGGLSLITTQFHPVTLGKFTASFRVKSNAPDSPLVTLTGEGIDYRIPSKIIDFGKVRIDSAKTIDIPVINEGNDSTGITSVAIMSGADSQDFTIVPNTAPPDVKWQLLTRSSGQNQGLFKVTFAPKLDPSETPFNKRQRMAIVKITTPDERSGRSEYFDTLYGYGVEPYVVATPVTIDFGTFVNPSKTDSLAIDTVINIGSYKGVINSLVQSNPTYFKILNTPSPKTSIDTLGRIPLNIDFQITQTGDFYDTIYVDNDSRSLPLVYLQGKVRAGIDTLIPIDLGTISNCDPIDSFFVLHNPSKVSLVIDTVLWGEGSGGFAFTGLENLQFPIRIAPDSTFKIGIRYIFPADSLNGTQIGKIIFKRTISNDLLSIEYDTGFVTLTRKIIQLSLSATEPIYNPNALDRPFSIPVYLNGNRLGFTELDNDTIKIQFSNDLMYPVGIDHAGSLTEEGKNGIGKQPNFIWDSISRILYVPMVNVGLSHDSSKNNLLFTIQAKVYLMSDSVVVASSSLGFQNQPCAFRVAGHVLTINYADECGDRTIRDLLLDNKVPVSISDPYPNPATDNASSVTIGYLSANEYMMSWQVFDNTGVKVLENPPFPIKPGQGEVIIPTSAFASSGLYYMTFSVTNTEGINQKQLYTKFSLVK